MFVSYVWIVCEICASNLVERESLAMAIMTYVLLVHVPFDDPNLLVLL